jgi:hypothetical protein
LAGLRCGGRTRNFGKVPGEPDLLPPGRLQRSPREPDAPAPTTEPMPKAMVVKAEGTAPAKPAGKGK